MSSRPPDEDTRVMALPGHHAVSRRSTDSSTARNVDIVGRVCECRIRFVDANRPLLRADCLLIASMGSTVSSSMRGLPSVRRATMYSRNGLAAKTFQM